MCSSIYEILLCIGLKPTHELSDFGILHQFMNTIVLTEHYSLFSWKVNWNTIDCWPLHMHGKLKDIVACLSRGDISCIKIGTNFITSFLLYSGSVWTLIDVLVNVLDCLDGSTDFQVDVTIKLNQNLPRMWNYMSIVKDILTFLNSPVILGASIVRISILLDNSLSSKGFGKALLQTLFSMHL